MREGPLWWGGERGDLSGVGVGDAEARGERGPEGFVVNLREREGEGPWCFEPLLWQTFSPELTG